MHAATIRGCPSARARRRPADRLQLPIALDDASEPEPDVAVVPRDPAAYRDAHSSRAPLIVEVAETSYICSRASAGGAPAPRRPAARPSRIDREYKESLYARAGVPEYWIIDLAHETLEVHRGPEASPATLYGWRFASVDLLRSPANVTPLIAAAPIRVADLFP